MLAQLVEDLVHLERRGQRLDQHRRPDRAVGDPQYLLRFDEHVVPPARFEVALELGQVEVGAAAASQQLLGVMKEVETEVEQGTRDLAAVDHDVGLGKVQPARTHQQSRDRLVELVLLAARRIGELDRAADGVEEVHLAGDHVLPRRRAGVLEIRHEAIRPRVERVDDHLAADRTGDLDGAFQQIRRLRRDAPVGGSDGLRLGEEAGEHARREPRVARLARAHQRVVRLPRAAHQRGEELERLDREDLVLALDGGAAYRGRGRFGGIHVGIMPESYLIWRLPDQISEREGTRSRNRLILSNRSNARIRAQRPRP